MVRGNVTAIAMLTGTPKRQINAYLWFPQKIIQAYGEKPPGIYPETRNSEAEEVGYEIQRYTKKRRV